MRLVLIGVALRTTTQSIYVISTHSSEQHRLLTLTRLAISTDIHNWCLRDDYLHIVWIGCHSVLRLLSSLLNHLYSVH